ncbi:hypothetical protein Pmani_039325 [Petrolisthes manimaculis]|uniref:Uncharacterized protein n=1 Tax=Petrolisthes manimaculis TaxID=1843537 RepID=A0AAE1NE04_9EUCA|nr:hypothetical protein Pmani_039325 [Petrolisthes manimaculis]
MSITKGGQLVHPNQRSSQSKVIPIKASGLLCYGFKKGQSEALGWVFCPSTSCYTVHDENINGLWDSRRGCADKAYKDTCQIAPTITPTDTVCFCNTFLCNTYSSATTITTHSCTSTLAALPLLLLPYLLHNFL